MNLRTFLAFVVIAVTLGVGVILGMSVQTGLDRTKAVCHAITEDSVISDCDYRNGTWYHK